MGEACLFPGFIPGSHTIPDLKRDEWCLMVFKKDHLQAVWQDGLENLFFKTSMGKLDEEKGKKKDEKSQIPFRSRSTTQFNLPSYLL